MASRPRRAGRGEPAALALADLGRQCRDARTGADLTQAAIARAVGIHRSWVSRFERGDASGISLVVASQLLAVVGLDLSCRAYPAGDPLRDTPQLGLLGTFRPKVSPIVGFGTEVPLPILGDLRSWDVLLTFPDEQLWGVEGESRVGDVQARCRSLMRKKRDGRVDGVTLLLSKTAHHLQMLKDHGPLLETTFPVSSAEALAALAAGRAPRGDALVVL